MTELETIEGTREDAVAVAAIKRGDPERYGELVKRHERRVFAIAWSRLGDAGRLRGITARYLGGRA